MNICQDYLKKNIGYLEQFLDYSSQNIDYDQISRNLLDITRAKYVLFNLYDSDGLQYKTISLVAKHPKDLTIARMVGFSVVGKTWNHIKDQHKHVVEQAVLELPDIHHLGQGRFSNTMLYILERLFNTGKVCVIRIAKDDKMLGTFALILEKNVELDNRDMVVMYANQTGMLLERIAADTLLADNERKFKKYTEEAPYGIFVVNSKEMRFIDLNREACRITGYSKSELLTMSPSDLYDEHEGIKVAAQIETIMASGSSFDEFEMIRSDGSLIYVSVNGVKISDDQIMGFVQDISERRRAEQEIREVNSMMKTLLDHTPQGFVLISKDYRIIEFNQKSADISRIIFGRTMAKGENVIKYTKNKERSRLIQFIDQALTGEMVKHDIPVFDRKKQERIFEVSFTPVRNEKNQVWAVAFTGYEITELKKTESALRKSEERFRLAALTTSDIIYELDVVNNIITWFGDIQSFLDLPPNKIPSSLRGWISLVHPEDREKIIDITRKDIDRRKPYSGEYRLRPNGHKDIFIEDYAIGVYDSENTLQKIVGAISDISSRKYYEEQLKFLSFYDQLTEVYNRSFFEEELRRINKSRYFPVSIIAVDLDGLKLINDTLGHYIGDEQLKKVADILRECIRGSDILARTGGDEFTIILPETSFELAQKVCERIETSVERINARKRDIPVSISVGVATALEAERAGGVQGAYKMADDLMYRSKLSKGSSAKSQIISSLMAALAERDYITEGHASRLSEYCIAIAKKMGLPAAVISNLDLLAKVHDLGKVGIPDAILFKPGPLTEEEWEIMRLHPEKGFRIAISSPDLAGIADLILKHHERWDGSGYPLGISGTEIPIEDRILAVVDSYDAMTNDRPYAKARSRAVALQEISQQAGKQYDPDVVAVFMELMEGGPSPV